MATGTEFLVNTTTNGGQYNSSVAMDEDGDFVVTWSSYNRGYGMYGQRYNAAGVAQGSEFQISTTTNGGPYYSSVAMDEDGDFVVTWYTYDQPGSGYGIYGQRYNAAGVAQGNEFQIHTTNGKQSDSSIAMDKDGDFVVTWTHYSDGRIVIYGQRYNADGVAMGSEFLVNTPGYPLQPVVAMDDDGDFVVTWTSNSDGSIEVYGQRYNADGVAMGSEFLVNTTTNRNSFNSSVAMDGDGDFVVSWTSYGQDGSGAEVYGQRYNADGVAQGGEFQINTTTNGNQYNSSIAMDEDGDFVVSWTSVGQDRSNAEVYGQRYNADGVAQGGEFLVNTTTNGSQYNSSIAMDANGGFAVAWTVSQSGGGGIYARIFEAEDQAPVNTAPTATNDEVSTSKNTLVTVDLSDNVTDAETLEGATLSVTSITGGTIAIIDSDAQLISFTPDTNFVGTASFTYTITDAELLTSNTATVEVQVGDIIKTGNGSQSITGNDGNDYISTGNGKDIITGLGGADTLLGENGADTIYGGAGDDIIYGGNCNDWLEGGSGNDQLTGGHGKDKFVLGAELGTDTITDFKAKEDCIGLTGGISFGSLSFSGNNILLTSTSEVLATLTGVNTSTLMAASFVMV